MTACLKQRMVIFITGLVQGVGFRPAVWNLAHDMNLFGWVNNSTKGVNIEVESDDEEKLLLFYERLKTDMPSVSRIDEINYRFEKPVDYTDFVKRKSDEDGGKTALVIPDLNICSNCKAEIFDPNNRRHLYPFTNCTQCGPRYSIIKNVPYDRSYTTMSEFEMCQACLKEYTDPRDRRFDAQPNACPVCGPHMSLLNKDGEVISERTDAVLQTQDLLRQGYIVAVKGLGGFHLMVDATNEKAVALLRKRKHRDDKAFALMCPSMYMLKKYCLVNLTEEDLLQSVESPIVLLERREDTLTDKEVAVNVAPNGNPVLGVMLPYTPLHCILMYGLEFPVVATSGNISGEPMVTDEYDALEKLSTIADFFLIHNRPIHVAVDDSIARVMNKEVLIIRRARGYAPLPVVLDEGIPNTLAVGAQQKNTVTLTIGNKAFTSPHNGDLETEQSINHFEDSINHMELFYGVIPEYIVSDKHRGYDSTAYAEEIKGKHVSIQHHQAHAFSCIGENKLKGSVLCATFDGTGIGDDGSIWGGEFFKIKDSSVERVAHLRTFPLIGGEAAIHEPSRCAFALLQETNLTDEKIHQLSKKLGLSEKEAAFKQMIGRKLNSPLTSSMGRLFDGVSALIGVRCKTTYEGQAARELEWKALKSTTREAYEFSIISKNGVYVLDWEPVILDIVTDIDNNIPQSDMAMKFHNAVILAIVKIARMVGIDQVALSGGCFLNKILLEGAISLLNEYGFKPYHNKSIPTNDGGISFGQVIALTKLLENKEEICA